MGGSALWRKLKPATTCLSIDTIISLSSITWYTQKHVHELIVVASVMIFNASVRNRSLRQSETCSAQPQFSSFRRHYCCCLTTASYETQSDLSCEMIHGQSCLIVPHELIARMTMSSTRMTTSSTQMTMSSTQMIFFSCCVMLPDMLVFSRCHSRCAACLLHQGLLMHDRQSQD